MAGNPVAPDEHSRDRPPGPKPSPTRVARRMLIIATIAVVVSIAGVVALATPTRNRSPAMGRLPVLGPSRVVYNGDLGDPFVLPVTSGKVTTGFIAFGTGDWPSRVPTARSADLTTWQDGPDALPTLPEWAAPDPKNSLSWAPAVLDTGKGYVLYVTLPDARSGQQCIGAAGSSTPEGPYTGIGDGPLLCQHDLGGSIDPAVVRDRSGRLHMLWKNDGNSVGAPSSIWEQQLRADGLGLVGSAHRMLSAGPAWQGGIIEEPAVIPAAGGGWWLFYSGNFFDKPEYATGLAFCPTLEGGCHETGDGPFLDTARLQQEKQFAPGGLETFRDGAGTLWAVFDTWNRPTRNGRYYCCRSLQVARVLSS